jgi:hypothetical protein
LYAGCRGLARLRRVVEKHLERLAPSPEHHPIDLDLLEAGVAHLVPHRVRKDPAALDVLKISSAASFGKQDDAVEPGLGSGRCGRGPCCGARRLRRRLAPIRAEEVALGDAGVGCQWRSRGGRRWGGGRLGVGDGRRL